LCRSFDGVSLGHQGGATARKTFRKHKRPVGRSWRVDETYIKVKGNAAARRFFEKAIGQNGSPETVTIDKSGANLAALNAVNAERETPIKVRQIKYLNNIVEQDHRAIKCRTRPMLGFKDFNCARVILRGIELMHMIKKGQVKCSGRTSLSAAQQFYSLVS
jgi:putative transposase